MSPAQNASDHECDSPPSKCDGMDYLNPHVAQIVDFLDLSNKV